MGDISISNDWHHSPHQYLHLLIIIGNILATQRGMGENAFHMVFQERWVFSHLSPNPALAATRFWAGYGELVGENSISPGKPCEMPISSHCKICYSSALASSDTKYIRDIKYNFCIQFQLLLSVIVNSELLHNFLSCSMYYLKKQ